MGGAIALRYAIAHQAKLTGLVLSAPVTQVEDRAAMRALGKLLGTVAPTLPVARVDPRLVSRDPAVVEAYRRDPLVHHGPVPAGTAAELIRHGETIPADAAGITLPTLLMWGTLDGLCPPIGSAILAQRLGAVDLTAQPFSGLYHEILNEPERQVVLRHLDGWLAARIEPRVGSAAPRG
jgi:alpha-beta hydrolase superfamily lysophospholipase